MASKFNIQKGKRTSTSSWIRNSNNMMYRELKEIIRDHALQFLPAKSLLQFRGVCRDWKFLISTPFFAHSQSNSFRTVSGFFSQFSPGKPSFISVNPSAYGVPDPSLSFLPEEVDIRTSSNGLICCQGRTGYNAFYVCNPVTKNWQKLPKPDNNHGSDPAVVLIFEPSVLKFTAEYNLVCAFQSELGGYEFDIYSSSSGSWRTSGEIFLGNVAIYANSGVHANGVVYWTSWNRRILAFDLSKERTRIFHGHGTLGVIGGKFCTGSVNNRTVSVNLLSNAYANTMQIHSNIPAWKTQQITLNSPVFIDGRYPEEVILLLNDTVLLRGGKALYLYDMKTQETRHLGNESNGRKKIVSYVNSLIDV